MTDYSQYGEQSHILEKLGIRRTGTNEAGNGEYFRSDGPPGRFLDIGAWNAKTFSNTRALVELGWSGVMVEPSPGPMHGLLKEYGNNERITLIQAAIGDGRDLAELHITDDALSTSNPDVYGTWKERGGYFGKLLVPQIPIFDLLAREAAFDFVNIDAEGSSASLLMQARRLWVSRAKTPTCICVEHDGHAQALADEFAPLGYQAQDLGINLLLWR